MMQQDLLEHKQFAPIAAYDKVLVISADEQPDWRN